MSRRLDVHGVRLEVRAVLAQEGRIRGQSVRGGVHGLALGVWLREHGRWVVNHGLERRARRHDHEVLGPGVRVLGSGVRDQLQDHEERPHAQAVRVGDKESRGHVPEGRVGHRLHWTAIRPGSSSWHLRGLAERGVVLVPRASEQHRKRAQRADEPVQDPRGQVGPGGCDATQGAALHRDDGWSSRRRRVQPMATSEAGGKRRRHGRRGGHTSRR